MTPWESAPERLYAMRGGDRGIGKPMIMLYSHDGFGLGHLSRTVHMAQCIRQAEPGASILIITSSPAAGRFAFPEQFEYIKFPSVTKSGAERYRPHLPASLESVIALRSALLLATVQQLRPDLLLVDHRPLGLKREVLPTLEWIHQHAPQSRTVVGLREVIDDAGTVIDDWKAHGIYDALDRLYDVVLVYGERSILDCPHEYAFPTSVARKTHFTGYLGRGPARRPREEVRRSLGLTAEQLVVVHAGGGGDGAGLIATYLRAVDRLPADVHSLIVTGPLMSSREREQFHRQCTSRAVTLVDYQDDLASCIAAADLSVSMGGYNTICEVLSAGTPAVVVPRVFPRREQYIRAQRLAAHGLVDVVLPGELTPEGLARRVRDGLAAPCKPRGSISLDGGRRAAELVLSLLETPGSRTHPVPLPVVARSGQAGW